MRFKHIQFISIIFIKDTQLFLLGHIVDFRLGIINIQGVKNRIECKGRIRLRCSIKILDDIFGNGVLHKITHIVICDFRLNKAHSTFTQFTSGIFVFVIIDQTQRAGLISSTFRNSVYITRKFRQVKHRCFNFFTEYIAVMFTPQKTVKAAFIGFFFGIDRSLIGIAHPANVWCRNVLGPRLLATYLFFKKFLRRAFSGLKELHFRASVCINRKFSKTVRFCGKLTVIGFAHSI